MPDKYEHLTQASRNEAFAATVENLGVEPFFEWAVTAMFYSSVHYGRAYLRSMNVPWTTTHKGFTTAFVKTSANPSLYGHYRDLMDESEAARYECKRFTMSDIAALRVGSFEQFKTEVTKLIAW